MNLLDTDLQQTQEELTQEIEKVTHHPKMNRRQKKEHYKFYQEELQEVKQLIYDITKT